jgi:UDP-N-acetylglucosamine--N-acetylmuramyl-(pentapeptide) pyrophosphoryl-undecaprenol N-acetylglucosamine transferase
MSDQSLHKRPWRMVIAGGGTGGHLFPGIAVAREFQRRNPATSVLFIGSGKPIEERVLAATGFPRATIAVAGLKGRGLWHQLVTLARLPWAVAAARRLLADFKTDLVLGVGGYSAGPVGLAAWLSGIPVVLHEQNLLPGITNRQLARFARRICVSFEASTIHFPPAKAHLTGNPVRPEILAAAEAPPSTEENFTVLVAGGSQGAHAINLAIQAALPRALQEAPGMVWIHQTGADDEAALAAAYRRLGLKAEVAAFFDDMWERYRQADLVICRAGATTLAELTCLGKASVLVPYPQAADNHQVLNARALAEAGAAEILPQNELSGDRVWERILHFRAHPEAGLRMAECARSLGRPQAAEAIVDHCEELLAEG